MSDKHIPQEKTPSIMPKTAPITVESIGNEGNKTSEDILKECNEVYKKYKRAKIPLEDTKALEEFREKIIKEHKQLYQAYPLVIRHMIDDNMYHWKAFEKYLRILEKNPWKNDEEKLESYARYFMILHRELTTHYDPVVAVKMKTDYLERLKREDKAFKDMYEVKKKEVDEAEARYKEERKTDTKKKFRLLAERTNIMPEIIEAMEMKIDMDLVKIEYVEALCDTFLRQHPDILNRAPDSDDEETPTATATATATTTAIATKEEKKEEKNKDLLNEVSIDKSLDKPSDLSKLLGLSSDLSIDE